MLTNGSRRSGIRRVSDSEKIHDIRVHVTHLAADVLGREAMEDVTVEILSASDPTVVALLSKYKQPGPLPARRDSEHPYYNEGRRKPLH